MKKIVIIILISFLFNINVKASDSEIINDMIFNNELIKKYVDVETLRKTRACVNKAVNSNDVEYTLNNCLSQNYKTEDLETLEILMNNITEEDIYIK